MEVSREHSPLLYVPIGTLHDLLNDEEALTDLYSFLCDSGYSSKAVCEALEIEGKSHRILTDTAYCSFVYYNEKKFETNPIAAIGGLFAIGGWLNSKTYEKTFPKSIRKILQQYNLVIPVENPYVRSTISLTECNTAYFLSDRMVERSAENIHLTQYDHNHVDPPNYSTISLLYGESQISDSLKPKHLDIGCGTGFHSIRLIDLFNSTIGIDINPRAILFSELNAKLNGNESIKFQEENCLGFYHKSKFEKITFNVPSVPKYKENLNAISSYSSKNGWNLGIEFINKKLRHLLSKNGVCTIWCIFAVQDTYGTIESILSEEIENITDFDIRIHVEKHSPFSISRENIILKTIPRNSYLLANSNDQNMYLDFVDRESIEYISPALINIQWSGTANGMLKVVEVESLVI